MPKGDPLPEPLAIDAALDWHQRLLRDFRGIVREEIGPYVRKAEAIFVATEHLIATVDTLGKQVGSLVALASKTANSISATAMRDERIEQKLDRFLNRIDPDATPPIA